MQQYTGALWGLRIHHGYQGVSSRPPRITSPELIPEEALMSCLGKCAVNRLWHSTLYLCQNVGAYQGIPATRHMPS